LQQERQIIADDIAVVADDLAGERRILADDLKAGEANNGC
jgi:hypothetical protein